MIDGNPGTPYAGAPGLMIAQLVQFNGVRQTNPFGPDARSFTLNDAVSGTVNVALTGSRIFGFAVGLWPSTLNATVTIPPGTSPGPAPTPLLPSTGDLTGSWHDYAGGGGLRGLGVRNLIAHHHVSGVHRHLEFE